MFNWQEQLFLIILDIILIPSSIFLAFLLRFFEEDGGLYLMLKWVSGIELIKIIIFILFCIIVFYFFGLYGKVWRYAGVSEVVSIFNSVSLCFILFSIPVFVSGGTFYPRSITIISWLICLSLVGGIRILLKWVSLRQKFRGSSRNLLIVGTGDEAEGYAREILRQKDLEYRPVGFVDEDTRKKNVKIHGVPVLGVIEDIPSLISRYKVEKITIALPVISRQLINKILSVGKQMDVDISIIPSVAEILDGNVTLTQSREIRIEDLLGREPVKFDNPEIADFIKGQKILVTGAGGSIGRELCRQIVNFKPQSLYLLGHGENSIHESYLELSLRASSIELKQIICDIQNREKIYKIFEKYNFTVVFHAAAHKHVPLMESHPDEAIANNIFGTRNLVEASNKYGVERFVMVSTDKAVMPSSVMGGTKKIAEKIVRSYAINSKTKFIIVRFGNVLGTRGSVVQTFKHQIGLGGPVTVTHPDMTRYFMTAPEAVLLILQAASMGHGGEIFILDMGRPVNILTLAKNLIELSGYDPEHDIPIVFSGLRPGEKLTESLHDNEEELLKTDNPKILSVKTGSLERDKLLKDIDDIENLLKKQSFEDLIEKFRSMVPTISFH
jgi:FlaA1/EpsC-like NDP-sugar epimerase